MKTTVLPSVIPPFSASPFIAGMPTVDLTDFATLRLELISVFLFGILVSAFVVKSVWNGFRKDFESLPELNYNKAFSLVCLWGLLFVIVLTMISGARELMTPGAWIKKGNTYTLNSEAAAEPANTAGAADDSTNSRRRKNLELIRDILKEDGVLQLETLPAKGEDLTIPKRMWQVPATFGLNYIYVPEMSAAGSSRVLLAEPEFFDNGRYVLWHEGEIELIRPGETLPFQTGAE